RLLTRCSGGPPGAGPVRGSSRPVSELAPSGGCDVFEDSAGAVSEAAIDADASDWLSLATPPPAWGPRSRSGSCRREGDRSSVRATGAASDGEDGVAAGTGPSPAGRDGPPARVSAGAPTALVRMLPNGEGLAELPCGEECEPPASGEVAGTGCNSGDR